MLSNNEIKQIRALSQKKFRQESGLFVVEGEKLVREAEMSGFEVVRVLRSEEIGFEAMSRITMLSSPSPALAVVRQRDAEDAVYSGGLVLALDGLRDPGNVGTIIRLADWFGIRHIWASRDTVELYNPKVVQATMGAIFRVEVSYCDLPDALSKAGCQVFGTYLDGENIYNTDLPSDGIIVMGSESDGISEAVGRFVSRRLNIPPFDAGEQSCESLNVAIATAITCSEFRRR